MVYKKSYMLVAILLTVILLLGNFAQPIFAAETEKQIVKVAYFDMGDYYQEQLDGKVISYDTEALEKIEKYSNLKFEYVNCGTWKNAITMLKNHEVDLVGTVQWTQERDNTFEFCLEGYGYTVGELASLNGNDIYEDYEKIGESVVGCTKNYVRMEDMKALFQKHGISPEIKAYDGQTELEKAFEAGEINYIASNSHTLKNEWNVVEKFSYAPFYLISWKGNTQLTDQIDRALIAINLREPNADDEMLQKYFPSIIGAPLTKEELNLIAENKTYDVFFDAKTKPTSWYDEETGTMNGALVEICKQIEKNTGIKLNILPYCPGETQLDSLDIETTTLVNGINDNPTGSSGVTNALLKDEFNLFYRYNHKLDLDKDKYSIAIVAGRENLSKYMNEKYPNATIDEYNTPLECIEAVSKGKSDMTYLDCRIAENAMLENEIENVREFPIEATHQGIALVITGEDSELLVNIINKGIEKLNQDEISDLLIQYALETQEPVTFRTLVRDHMSWIVWGTSFIILVMLALSILFTYAKVMKKQKIKIEKANADKSEFFSRMSHDMRTPMNGILGMIRLTKESNSISEIYENMDKAESAGEYMLSLINDTLDLQRLESKRFKLEKDIVITREYFNNIFSILKVSAEQKKIEFDVKYKDIDMENYIELDAVRVKQIFSNLISNAIKFTPEGGTVEIIIESLGQEGNILHHKCQIKDTGVGMSEDFIKNRLYQPYAQENNEMSSELTGSGLGMAITKNLVEVMGGKLVVESELGEGTTFTVFIDLLMASKEAVKKAELEREEKEKAILSDLTGKRILLCEDHLLNAEIAKRLLEKVGCSVEWVENGKLAVDKFEKMKAYSYDAILMDIRMPVMDGLTATMEIRKLNKADASTIPIIAMTANAYESDKNRCMEAGMNVHVAKPVNPKQLYTVLYNCLN